jgi:hypothetical protein
LKRLLKKEGNGYGLDLSGSGQFIGWQILLVSIKDGEFRHHRSDCHFSRTLPHEVGTLLVAYFVGLY